MDKAKICKGYTGKRINKNWNGNDKISQESFVAARRNKIELVGEPSHKTDIIEFILNAEIETFKQVKNLITPSSFLNQPFGYHAFNKINPQRLLLAKKLYSTRKYKECAKTLDEITTKVGLYRTVYCLMRDGELDLLTCLIRQRHMVATEEAEILSICYEELRTKNVPITQDVENFIQTRLLTCKCKLLNNWTVPPTPQGTNTDVDRIKMFIESLQTVAETLKKNYKKNCLVNEKTLGDKNKLIFNLKFLVENLRIIRHLIEVSGLYKKSPKCVVLFEQLEFFFMIYKIALAGNDKSFDKIYLVILNERKIFENLFKFIEIFKNLIFTKKSFAIDDDLNDFGLDMDSAKKIYYLAKICEKLNVIGDLKVEDGVGCLAVERFLSLLKNLIERKLPVATKSLLYDCLPFEIVSYLQNYNSKSIDYSLFKNFQNGIDTAVSLQASLKASMKVFNYFLCYEKYQILSCVIRACDASKNQKILNKIFKNFTNIEIISILNGIDDQPMVDELNFHLERIDGHDADILHFRRIKFWDLRPLGMVTENEEVFNYVINNFRKLESTLQTHLKVFQLFLTKFDQRFFELNGKLVLHEIAFQRVFEILSMKFPGERKLQKFKSQFSQQLHKSEKGQRILKDVLNYLKPEMDKIAFNQLCERIERIKLMHNGRCRLRNLVSRPNNLKNYDEISRITKHLLIEDSLNLDAVKMFLKNDNNDEYENLLENLSKFYDNRFGHAEKKNVLSSFFAGLELDEEVNFVLMKKLDEISEKEQHKFDNDLEEFRQIYDRILSKDQDNDDVILCAELLSMNLFQLLLESNLTKRDPFFLDDYSPILYGESLNNYLNECDPLIDLIFPDSRISIFYQLNHYLKNLYVDEYSSDIQIIFKTPQWIKEQWTIEKIRKRYEKISKWVDTQSQMFEAIEHDDLFSFREQIEKESDSRGISIDDKSVSHYFHKNKYLNTTTVKCPKLHLAILLKQTDLIAKYAKKDTNARDLFEKTALHYAVDLNSKDIAKVLLSEGARIDAVDKSNLTPLHYSIIRGFDDMTQFLIEKGSDPFRLTELKLDDFILPINGFLIALMINQKSIVSQLSKCRDQIRLLSESYSLIFLSALPVDFVKIFINSGIDINQVYDFTGKRMTLLHGAAYFGSIETVRYLIRLDANIHILTESDETALHLSAINGNLDIFILLLEQQPDLRDCRDKYGHTPLDFAILYDRKDIICHLQTEVVIDLKDLRSLCVDGQLDLLKLSAENTELTHDLLLLSVDQNQVDVVQFLIEHSTINDQLNKKDNNGNTALHIAVLFNYINIVDILTGSKTCDLNTLNEKQEAPIHIAIKNNNFETFSLLLDRGANIDINSEIYLTPIALSCLSKNVLFVHTLLKYGANPDLGYPLCFAIEDNQIEICQLLIEFGANVNLRSTFDITPLHLAAINNRNDVIMMLLRAKAFPNAQLCCTCPFNESEMKFLSKQNTISDIEGFYHLKTPLHFAIEGNNLEAVQMLVSHGASVNRCCNANRNPLNLAKTVAERTGSELIHNYLIRNGAILNQISVDSHLSKILETIKMGDGH